MLILLLSLSFLITSPVNTQVLQFGTCPEVKTVNLFDVERFLGIWFVIERFPAWFEDRSTCSYKLFQACGRRVEIQHVFVRDDIEFILHVNSTYNPGDEAVFNVDANSVDPVGIPLSVVNTDYTNYAIIYGCKVNYLMNIKYTVAWILSRDSTLPKDILTEARKTLIALPHTSPSYLEPVQQDKTYCAHHWTAHIHAINNND